MATIEFGINDSIGWSIIASGQEFAGIYQQKVRRAQLAEQLGFRYCFITEHQNNDDGAHTSPAVYLSALAQCTSTLRLGIMVFPLPFHNPIRLAQDAAMVDQVSRGRVEFGAGAGVLEHEFLRWDLPFAERREMAYEALEIIEKAWVEEIVTYDGKYWRFDEALPWPKPYQKPHPPIWYGTSSPTSFEFAARHNYNVSQFGIPDPWAAEMINDWRRMWKGFGHDGPMPRSFLTATVYVADTDEQAREEAERNIVLSFQQGQKDQAGTRIGRTKMGWKGPADTETNRQREEVWEGMATSLDYWLDNGLAHVGSPKTVARRLEKQHQLLGFNLFCGHFQFGNLPRELVEKSMRLFGEQVMPALS